MLSGIMVCNSKPAPELGPVYKLRQHRESPGLTEPSVLSAGLGLAPPVLPVARVVIHNIPVVLHYKQEVADGLPSAVISFQVAGPSNSLQNLRAVEVRCFF